MYKVKGGGITIYEDVWLTESVKTINPKLTMKDNTAGTLEITLPPGNAGYNSLERMVSEIIVYRDNVEIWSGRIISERKDFSNNRILTCEGELAYLNDTTQPPKEYHNMKLRDFLSALLTEHNSKVSADKRFTIGVVDVTEGSDNDNVYRITNDNSTLEAILDKLVNRLGGHLVIRKQNGIRYLDYFKDFLNVSSQTIRFGQNLLDFTRNWDMTKIATVVIPRGARLETLPPGYPPALEAYLDVSSVNGGSRYVTNEQGISKYGWIEVVVDWNDVTIASNLLAKAKLYLSDIQFDEMVVEASAVDLRYLGVSTESIKLLDEVRCVSAPHGMDRLFPVTELSIQLDKPENSTYTLGSKITNTFTSEQKTANQSIIDRIDKLPKVDVDAILEDARDTANRLINHATNGYITIRKNDNDNGTYSEELIVSNNSTYETSTKCWKWTLGGLGYFTRDNSSSSWSNPTIAITMDGAIVADSITTGRMSADRVRTGTLASVDGNVVWNLNSGGSLTINSGSINLGNGAFTVDNNGKLYMSKGSIAIGSRFSVDSNGNLTATSVNLSGNITMSSGNITWGSVNAPSAGQVGAIPNSVGSIISTHISNGAITTPKIATNAVTANEISVTALSAISADMGTLTAGSITSNSSIDVNTNLYVGNNISLSNGSASRQSIVSNGQGNVTFNPTGIEISANGGINCYCTVFRINGREI